MRKEFVGLICVLAFAICVSAEVGAIDLNRPHGEHPPSLRYGVAGEQEETQKYTCPMHPEVITDHPGNCPKCGRSEEHTSELQSQSNLVCRLLLEKKKTREARPARRPGSAKRPFTVASIRSWHTC